jgi:hypothetical protein
MVSLEELFADPPAVHSVAPEGQGSELVVKRTETGCYEFLDRHLCEGDRTLETGLGLSTVLFALRGAHHLCITPVEQQVERLVSYCARREIPTDRLRFEIGFSDDVIGGLALEPLDLVFIDGGHGFPTPIIDWYYGCRTLRVGGIVVIDDTHLPAVDALLRFLRPDPRWQELERTQRWAAFRLIEELPAVEDWYLQPWAPQPLGIRARNVPKRVRRLLLRPLRRLKR